MTASARRRGASAADSDASFDQGATGNLQKAVGILFSATTL